MTPPFQNPSKLYKIPVLVPELSDSVPTNLMISIAQYGEIFMVSTSNIRENTNQLVGVCVNNIFTFNDTCSLPPEEREHTQPIIDHLIDVKFDANVILQYGTITRQTLSLPEMLAYAFPPITVEHLHDISYINMFLYGEIATMRSDGTKKVFVHFEHQEMQNFIQTIIDSDFNNKDTLTELGFI